MTSLESRIHTDADLAAAEITPDDIPPLLHEARDRAGRADRPARARFWMAPLAAAASVVAIIAIVITVAQAGSGNPAPVRHGRPAPSTRTSDHPEAMLGPEALDDFFPATGAQYTAGLAFEWTWAKIRARFFGSCMARAGYPQPPFTEPEQSYLLAFPDNSQFPDLAQRARTRSMTGSLTGGGPGLPGSAAGRAAVRLCQPVANKPFAAINQTAGPLQSRWLDEISTIQASAGVTAMQPSFAACLEVHGIPADYADQQRPTASNPLFIGFFAWMDHLGQTATSTQQQTREEHRWTPVFVRCAGPTVSLMQRLQLAARTRFFARYAQRVAMISKLATELPDLGR